MSEQRIDPEVRHAIWLANARRCAYCSEPLDFGEVDIDHILPESLANDVPALTKAKVDLGLPADFRLESLRNLLPAHRRCNRAKSNRQFSAPTVALFTRIAEDNEARVVDILDAKRRTEKRDNVMVSIARAMKEGLILPTDLTNEFQVPDMIALAKPLEFDGMTVRQICPNDVGTLLDASVFGAEGIAFYSSSDERKMEVRTCREYRAAIAAKYYPRTTLDIKLSARFATIDAVLTAVEMMRVPRVSYISAPHRGVVDLGLLPVDILPAVSPDDPGIIAEMKGQTLGDLLARNEIKVLKMSSDEISIEWRWGLILRELCRSDLDGDGIEDILCECYCWAPGGTLGFGWVALLSRRSQDGQFTVQRFEP